MSRTAAFVIAAVLIVLGVAAFPLQNLGKPEAECGKEGAPSSGFVDEDSGCPITIDSYNEIREYESGPKLYRIGGIVLIIAGLGFVVVGVTRKKQQPGTPPDPESPTAT